MQIHTEFRGIPGNFTAKNTAEFRGISRNSVCFSKNSVFRRKSKTHFRGHPMYVPSSELGLSQPLYCHAASVPLPPEPGGHTRLRVRGWGWGCPNSDDWRKSLFLCPLCDVAHLCVIRIENCVLCRLDGK